MQTSLSPAQLEAVEAALLGPESAALIELVFRLNLAQPLNQAMSAAIPLAQRLGWVAAGGVVQLTPLGYLVADPLREYWFWLDRNRCLHGEADHPHLAAEQYDGKSVLEVGSGFGCNLLSLGLRAQGRFIGVEPMAIYRQFTPILSRREGLIAPRVVEGVGRALPFPDESFDIVLCYSSHQYMEIQKALREMTRVLRPGGQLQIIGATLDSYATELLRQIGNDPRPVTALNGLRTLTNTLSYQYWGRRVWIPASQVATAAPIYPARGAMLRWIQQSGLTPREDLIQPVGSETCFIADKPRKKITLRPRSSVQDHDVKANETP